MADIECYCDPAEGEPCDFVSVKHPQARKQHKCMECYDTIMAGERYARLAGKCDGEMFTHKTCLFCEQEYNRINQIQGIAFGELACALVAELRGEL